MRIHGVDRPLAALALGSHYYRLTGAAHWHAVLDHYLEAGGTLLDTARSYGDSEQVIGRWLADRAVRERLTLLTKGGHGTRHGVTGGDFAAVIEAELSTSLEVLGTEQVELYLLHRDSPAFDVGTIIEALNRELRRGRIRAIGASNWEYDRIEQANAYARARGLHGFGVISNHLALARSAQPFWPGLVSVGREGWRWHRRTGIPLLVFSSPGARLFFRPLRTVPARRRPRHPGRSWTPACWRCTAATPTSAAWSGRAASAARKAATPPPRLPWHGFCTSRCRWFRSSVPAPTKSWPPPSTRSRYASRRRKRAGWTPADR